MAAVLWPCAFWLGLAMIAGGFLLQIVAEIWRCLDEQENAEALEQDQPSLGYRGGSN
jgi:hypothetical protein